VYIEQDDFVFNRPFWVVGQFEFLPMTHIGDIRVGVRFYRVERKTDLM
jgi:hypothetical protein